MKKYLLIFFLVFFIPLVFAQPPQTQIATQGLDIEYPKFEYAMQGSEFKLHTHVFNASNGVPMNSSTTSCLVHLYNASGSHTLQSLMGFDSNGIDFELTIDSANFTTLGIHAYIIQCNTSISGGFSSGIFEVTPLGQGLTTPVSILWGLLLLTLCGSFLFFLYTSITIPFRNTRNENGLIVSVNDMKYFKVAAMVFSYLTLMGIFGVARLVSFNYLYYIGVYQIFEWMYWFMFSLLIPIIIVSGVLMLVMFFENKRIKNALMRGVPVR